MIKNKDISLTRAEENQADLESNLTDIRIGNKKNSAQKKVIKNVEKFRDSRQAVINFIKTIPQWLTMLHMMQNKKKEQDLKY